MTKNHLITGMAVCIITFLAFGIGYNMYISSIVNAEVVLDPNPTVYVAIPSDMKVEGVLSKEYKHNQDIILNADVNDPSEEVVSENIKWAKVTNGNVDPIATGATIHIAGGNLKPGKHTFLVTYSNTQGYGAEFEYNLTVSEPVVHTKINLKESEVKWHGYVNNHNNTVTHMKTGFTWMIVDDGYDRTFNEVVKYAKDMSAKTGKTWSIPTLTEWKQISDMSKNGYHVVDEPFKGLKSGAKYWTKSAPKNAPTVAGKQVVYAMEVSRLTGNGQHLRTKVGVVTLDTPCYPILLNK